MKITSTMQPDTEIEVDEAEFTDLVRMGLVAKVDGKPVTTEKAKEKANNA